MIEIPMSSPDLTEAEIAAVTSVLRTRILSRGQRLREFEERFAAYVGAKHGVAVSSGTAALHLCVLAAGVRANDLVLTTPFSFVASANCIVYERAVPVFVDVEANTGNLDPTLVVEAASDLTGKPPGWQRWLPPSLRDSPGADAALKALLPVHAFGQPGDMQPLLDVADRERLVVIEDACEAIGAEYHGRRAGQFGAAAAFAFYPNKQMTTGEGGMLVTDDRSWDELFRSLRNQGRDASDTWLTHTRLGYNYRLDEMSAALGLAQLERIDELLRRREQVASWYGERLQDVELVERPSLAGTTTRMSWFVYVVRIRPPAHRNRVMQHLREAGVPSRPYFSPIHLQPFYQTKFGYRRGEFPVAERLGDVSLALPFSSVMTETQVERVCTVLEKVLSRSGGP